jgi:hypothetical protein
MTDALRLIQFAERAEVRVAISDGDFAIPIRGINSAYELAQRACAQNLDLRQVVDSCARDARIELEGLARSGRLLAPFHHPEPTRMLVSGTGLTHIGSAEARDRMHKSTRETDANVSDSMKMFQMGLAGGRPPATAVAGVQPEWFFKGTGECVVAPRADIHVPDLHRSIAEEPEIVAIYIVSESGVPARVGYTLGNDVSDHETEKTNYLYLAHSKLLPCSIGPELLVGDLPSKVIGRSRILRNGAAAWEGEFASGEDYMCHSLRNLEYHHFKYPRHRVPNTIHAHFLGCPVMSFNDGFKVQSGDEFEIDVPVFGLALRNRIVCDGNVVPTSKTL